ncbi:hypothetical protein B0E49_03995 [Polaromonas sp. C04]|nr:hypothetical protein B0E49_03995 [Polaromonas sp. C04]
MRRELRGTADSVVKLRNVSVQYGSSRVLDNVSLDCAPSEFLVLIGQSGCGKTTILNLLAGLLTPSAGQISVLGETSIKARQRMAYMFARDALMPWRTAQRNVEYGLYVHGVPRAERSARARDMLERVGLGVCASMYPWQLSQGMRQRVALARTWALEPQLLLMDEPFAALDAQTKVKMRAEFAQMWERSRPSVVFVTHDLTEALLLADRIMVVKAGRIESETIVQFDRPRKLEDLVDDVEFRKMERELRSRLE